MASNLPVLRHSLDQYMLEVGRVPLLSRQEEAALAQQLQADDEASAKEAARLLVASNLRFVVKIAYEYKNYNIRMTDLIQEGNVGLMHAVSKFDPDRGYRLISYAVWWIKAYIQNFIVKNWSMVPISGRRKLLFGKQKQLPDGAGVVREPDDPTQQEDAEFLIAAERDTSPTRRVARKQLRAAYRDFSLDAPVGGEESGSSHLTRLESPAESAEESVARGQLQEQVQKAIATVIDDLDDRGRTILKRRLLSTDPASLTALGKEFGVSRERARQLEARVKKKLKAALAHLGDAEILGA